MLLHHAGALFYLLSACVNSNSKLEFICLEFELELELGRKRNRKRKKTQNPNSNPIPWPTSLTQAQHFFPRGPSFPLLSWPSSFPSPSPLASGPPPPLRPAPTPKPAPAQPLSPRPIPHPASRPDLPRTLLGPAHAPEPSNRARRVSLADAVALPVSLVSFLPRLPCARHAEIPGGRSL